VSIEAVGFLAILCGIIGIFAPIEFFIYVFFGSLLIGSAAAIILTSLGSSTIIPPDLLLIFLAVQCFSKRKYFLRVSEILMFPRAGFWLLIFSVYGIVSALLFPRLFEGATYVYAISRTTIGLGIFLTPLSPTTGNITQTTYLIGDLICFIIFYTYASDKQTARTIAHAALACAFANLLFVVIDLATYYTGTANLLQFLRTANYRMLDEAAVFGFKRIVGFFPEASSFGGFTICLFTFCLRLWLLDIYARVTLPLAAFSLLALLFSTSSTAYVGISIVLVSMYIDGVRRVVTRQVTPATMAFVAVVPLIVLACTLGLALSDSIWSIIGQLVDATITDKLSSDSGIERMAWTDQAWINFLDTGGFGAGIGSIRSSSLPAVVLGSVGIFGAITYVACFCSIFFGRKEVGGLAAVQSAARWACFSVLGAGLGSAGSVDLGLLFWAFAGLACGRTPLSHRSGAPELPKRQVLTTYTYGPAGLRPSAD